MRIGVCIPCYAPHILYLQSTLASIEQQVRKPDIVSISISSYKDSEQIDTSKYSFPVVITSTSEKQCAGKNRNVAAEAIASQVDILSFFDADDLMHPRRLEILEKHFIEHKLDSCIHYFMRGSVDSRNNIQTIQWPNPSESIHLTGFTTGRDTICGRVWWSNERELGQCGQITVRSAIWNIHKYKERMVGEDSEYVWQVYTSGSKHAFLSDVLSMYIQNTERFNNKDHFYTEMRM